MARGSLGEIFAEATQHPIILVGGVAGVGLLAVLATLRGSANKPAPASTSTTDPSSSPTDLMGQNAEPGSSYDPNASPYAPAGYDPFGSMGTSIYPTSDPSGGSSDPGVTADGCSWPPPAVPPELVGKGSWGCSNGSWTWNWIDPQGGGGAGSGTTNGGCPLPKPTLAPALIGKYAFHCVAGKWQLVPTTPTGVPPPVIKPPVVAPNVSAGRHATFAGHVTAQHKLIIDSRTRAVVTLAHAEHWNLGPAVSGDTTPNKTGGLIKVRRIVAAPSTRHALVGRYLKV